MTSVFVVQHVHESEYGGEDVKLIGVYSTRETAEAAVERSSRLPGFSDASGGFYIDEYRLDRDHWVEGYVTVSEDA